MRKILFVDDEAPVLRAMRRTFRRSTFNVLCAESGKEALDIIKNNEIDMVITDIRMPQMDGFQLLREIASYNSQILCLVVSGWNELATMVSAVLKGLVHQCLPKPWENAELVDRVTAIFNSYELLRNDDRLFTIVNNSRSLPVLSSTYYKCMDMVTAGMSLDSLASVIAMSPQLTACFLHVANSVFYNICTSDIKSALSLLGSTAVREIFIHIRMSPLIPDDAGFEKMLTAHSNQSSLIFQGLYRKLFDENVPHEISSAGLLHQFACFINLSSSVGTYEEYVSEDQESLTSSYCKLTGLILQWWNLPSYLVDILKEQHKLLQFDSISVDDKKKVHIALVQIADYYSDPEQSLFSEDYIADLCRKCSLDSGVLDEILSSVM